MASAQGRISPTAEPIGRMLCLIPLLMLRSAHSRWLPLLSQGGQYGAKPDVALRPAVSLLACRKVQRNAERQLPVPTPQAIAPAGPALGHARRTAPDGDRGGGRYRSC